MRALIWLLLSCVVAVAQPGPAPGVQAPGGIITAPVAFENTIAAASDWRLGTKGGNPPYPVIMLAPGPLAGATANIALDLFPTGSPTDNAGSGAVWLDPCNNATSVFQCSHIGITAAGDAIYGGSQFGGAAVGRVLLLNNIQAPPSEQTVIDAKYNLFSRGALVGGAGTYVGNAPVVEEVGENLLGYSTQLQPVGFSYTNTTWGGAGVESPNGGLNAILATTTSAGGFISQTKTISANTSNYYFSVYVSSASASPLAQLNASFYTGGTSINSGVTIVPSTGALALVGTAPVSYGAERINLGCQTNCSGPPTTWWRVWTIVANANDTVVSWIFYPGGFSGAATSAIVASAMMDNASAPESYIPTTTASSQTRPVGTSIVPLNASSINNLGAYNDGGTAFIPTASVTNGATQTMAAGTRGMVLENAALVATQTVELPSITGIVGQTVWVSSDRGITALTMLNAGGNAITNSPTSILVGGMRSMISDGAIWHPVQ